MFLLLHVKLSFLLDRRHVLFETFFGGVTTRSARMVSVFGESDSILKHVTARGVAGRKTVVKFYLRMGNIKLCIWPLAFAGGDLHCYGSRGFVTRPLGIHFLSRLNIVVKVAANFYEVICEFPDLQ